MTYLIESSHSKEDCLKALDETRDELLKDSYFACSSGMHSGWAVVSVPNEAVARDMVPSFIRSKARVTPVAQYSRDQIRSFHT